MAGPIAPVLIRAAMAAHRVRSANEAVDIIEGPAPGRKKFRISLGGLSAEVSIPAKFDSLDDLPI